jgi:putative membrane protein insertion efficiency factor
VSALRQCLKRPEVYLVALALLGAIFVADSFRPPERQVGVRAYIGSVRLYQKWGSPRLDGYVRCRFRPTCSRYSIEVVRKHGLWRGLTMSGQRIWRCRTTVAMGTEDPPG